MGDYVDAIADGQWQTSKEVSDYAKRIEALVRVAEAANRWMTDKDEKNGTFHYMALKRELRELEALKNETHD